LYQNFKIDKKNEGLEMKLEALLSQEQDPFTTQNIFLEQINKNRFASFEKAAAEVFQNADVDALVIYLILILLLILSCIINHLICIYISIAIDRKVMYKT
jgi:hypothetical protein